MDTDARVGMWLLALSGLAIVLSALWTTLPPACDPMCLQSEAGTSTFAIVRAFLRILSLSIAVGQIISWDEYTSGIFAVLKAAETVNAGLVDTALRPVQCFLGPLATHRLTFWMWMTMPLALAMLILASRLAVQGTVRAVLCGVRRRSGPCALRPTVWRDRAIATTTVWVLLLQPVLVETYASLFSVTKKPFDGVRWVASDFSIVAERDGGFTLEYVLALALGGVVVGVAVLGWSTVALYWLCARTPDMGAPEVYARFWPLLEGYELGFAAEGLQRQLARTVAEMSGELVASVQIDSLNRARAVHDVLTVLNEDMSLPLQLQSASSSKAILKLTAKAISDVPAGPTDKAELDRLHASQLRVRRFLRNFDILAGKMRFFFEFALLGAHAVTSVLQATMADSTSTQVMIGLFVECALAVYLVALSPFVSRDIQLIAVLGLMALVFQHFCGILLVNMAQWVPGRLLFTQLVSSTGFATAVTQLMVYMQYAWTATAGAFALVHCVVFWWRSCRKRSPGTVDMFEITKSRTCFAAARKRRMQQALIAQSQAKVTDTDTDVPLLPPVWTYDFDACQDLRGDMLARYIHDTKVRSLALRLKRLVVAELQEFHFQQTDSDSDSNSSDLGSVSSSDNEHNAGGSGGRSGGTARTTGNAGGRWTGAAVGDDPTQLEGVASAGPRGVLDMMCQSAGAQPAALSAHTRQWLRQHRGRGDGHSGDGDEEEDEEDKEEEVDDGDDEDEDEDEDEDGDGDGDGDSAGNDTSAGDASTSSVTDSGMDTDGSMW